MDFFGQLARGLEAEHGRRLTTPFHDVMALDELGHSIALLLDGERDTEQITAQVVKSVVDGDFEIQRHGVPVSDRKQIDATAREIVSKTISTLATRGLLMP